MGVAVLHRTFIKDFKKLPQDTRARLVERKNLFLKDPFNPLLNNHALNGIFAGCRSINISGDIRAVYFDRGTDVVFIHIGTHAQLYE
ncbi:type II toxin-antitoxin system mRNA interferase toxin, RelE/StbE family [Candidatus Kaiserbacteria bacterium]|nr:type II toxin-antitoxin system mRNA interferase toxin, RelE/StbE family [Candidatus Kaiserbacteria bacterium]